MEHESRPISLGSPVLHVILSSTLVAVMGVSLISPALPAIQDALGLTEFEVGLVITAFTLPGIFFAPFAGMLADQIGRRPILVACLVGYGATGGAIIWTRTFLFLLTLRLIQGIAASGLTTIAVALVGDHYSGLKRNTVMGINGASLAVGTAVYPVIGGGLADFAWYLPFGVFALGIGAGVYAYFVLDETFAPSCRCGVEYFRAAIANVPRPRALWLYGIGLCIFILLYGAVLTSIPLLLATLHDLSARDIGLVLTVPAILTALAASQNGRLVDWWSNEVVIGLGFLAYGISLTGCGIVSSTTGITGFLALFGLGMGLTMPSLDTAIASMTSEKFRGGVMSIRTGVIRIGQTIGPVLYTGLAPLAGYPILLNISGVVSLIGGGLALARWRRPA